MKRCARPSLWAAIVLYGYATVSAQNIKESTISMSQGSQNALTVVLPRTKAGEVTKAWEKYSRDFGGKTKTDKKSGEVFTDNAVIKDISGNNTIDLYARAKQDADGTVFAVWFDLGGAYLSSQQHSDRYAAAEKLVYKFALSVSTGLVEEELKAEEKKLKQLQSEQQELEKAKSRLENDIKSYEKEIEALKAKIEKSKSDISSNAADQQKKRSDVDVQQKVVEQLRQKLKSLK